MLSQETADEDNLEGGYVTERASSELARLWYGTFESRKDFFLCFLNRSFVLLSTLFRTRYACSKGMVWSMLTLRDAEGG